MRLIEFQKEIFQNKVNRKFNVTDVGKEIILMTEELGELARAYKNSNKKPANEINNKDEMLGVDSEEVLKKIIEKNKKRSHTGNM